ncbi:5-formyltetrahydrofolate cyclo-ligase [Aestuariivivens sediminis]|uniref:5-formyltetrahydrofolate cyclo-ligase n=1 Tax=Aestuariivivens sediminis TaxID=2913557 RepID=UPI001F58A441|nr:5-formyltetrahydrofolate cyclo-ligase [Aestuariivivens sediminis]
MVKKAELRKKYKALRHKLDPKDIEECSLAIANQLLKLPIWNYSFYHIYLSIQELKEINTEYILNILSGKDKHIVISRSNFKTGTMVNFLLTDNTVIKKNSRGIPEPVDGIEIENTTINVVFVPLLAFDRVGHRVGYGKGFYDQFLGTCNPEVLKIGLSFFEAEDAIEDLNPNDIKLNYCVTPHTVYAF